MDKIPVVVFVCVHNAGRSLAARVLLDHYAEGRLDVRSAGSDPADEPNAAVVTVFANGASTRQGVPQGPHRRGRPEEADIIVTMGCGDSCPYFPGKRYLDWDLEDPAGKPIEDGAADRRRDRPQSEGSPR